MTEATQAPALPQFPALGARVGEPEVVAGITHHRFEHGEILVNDSGHDAQACLPGNWVRYRVVHEDAPLCTVVPLEPGAMAVMLKAE